MSVQRALPLDDLARVDGGYQCPRCLGRDPFESMTELVEHISDAHAPLREWFLASPAIDQFRDMEADSR